MVMMIAITIGMYPSVLLLVLMSMGQAIPGVGIDPAVVLAAEGKGKGIGRLIAGIGSDVVSARLSDLDGGGRVEAGSGSLDLMSYEATLVTVGYAGMLVVDVRGLADPIGSAERLAGG